MGIYVNQVGYPVQGTKIAITTTPCNFQIINTGNHKSIYDGVTCDGGFDASAGASTYHLGVDLSAPEGTPIYASRSGTVTAATIGDATPELTLKEYSKHSVLSVYMKGASGYVLYQLYMTRELLRRRSIWMTLAAACVIICVLVSLILKFPSPPYTLPQV